MNQIATTLRRALLVPLLAAATLAGCAGDDPGPGGEQPDAGLTAVKSYLTDHTADLVEQADRLQLAGDAYLDLARSARFNYRRLLRDRCEAVGEALTEARNAFVKANPAYQSIAGIVAGIPRTAQYGTDIEQGSDTADTGDEVSFNLRLPDGRTMRQPGDLFFLIETSLYGTNPDLVVEGVRPDVNCDGRSEFGEGLPDAAILKAAADELARQAADLDKDATEIVITPSDAFTALVTMTPKVRDYFRQWERSAFVTGEGRQQEEAFVATSRLSDIADLLAGLEFTYGQVEPLIAERDEDQADQIGSGLEELAAGVSALRDREAAGEKFSPAQAAELGAEMGARAERIAASLAQAARDLEVEIQDG